MKILILLFFPFLVFAKNYVGHSPIDCSKVFSTLGKCQIEKTNCASFDFGESCLDFDLADEMIDGNAQFSAKTNIVACGAVDDDPETPFINEKYQDCLSKFPEITCDDPEATKFVNAEMTEAYCSKFLGYEQVPSGKKILVLNQSKKDARLAAQAQEDAYEGAIEAASKRIGYGKRILAIIIVRNAQKGLNKGQIKQMNQTYAEIKDLLETGSLETAKDEILAITPDGTIVTEDDKTALVAEIDKLLGL